MGKCSKGLLLTTTLRTFYKHALYSKNAEVSGKRTIFLTNQKSCSKFLCFVANQYNYLATIVDFRTILEIFALGSQRWVGLFSPRLNNFTPKSHIAGLLQGHGWEFGNFFIYAFGSHQRPTWLIGQLRPCLEDFIQSCTLIFFVSDRFREFPTCAACLRRIDVLGTEEFSADPGRRLLEIAPCDRRNRVRQFWREESVQSVRFAKVSRNWR